ERRARRRARHATAPPRRHVRRAENAEDRRRVSADHLADADGSSARAPAEDRKRERLPLAARRDPRDRRHRRLHGRPHRDAGGPSGPLQRRDHGDRPAERQLPSIGRRGGAGDPERRRGSEGRRHPERGGSVHPGEGGADGAVAAAYGVRWSLARRAAKALLARARSHSSARRAQGNWVPSSASPATMSGIPGPGSTSSAIPTTSRTEPATITAIRRAPA